MKKDKISYWFMDDGLEERIRFGFEKPRKIDDIVFESSVCKCGAKYNEYHDKRCEFEECPRCGRKMIISERGCGCTRMCEPEWE